MIDPRVAIPEDVLEDLRRRSVDGASVSELTARLYEQDYPFGRAMLALACSGVMTLGEAKRALHLSEAYAEGRTDREEFEQSALNAFAQPGQVRRERAA